MRTFIRLLLIVIVLVAVGSFFLGYWTGPLRGRRDTVDRPVGTAGETNTTERAREIGAQAGERLAVAGVRAKEELTEAGITAKIKAKMALDDAVKARAIDVTTNGATVTLTGRVATIEERDRAERLARETAGVNQVVDRLVVER